jgi:hypothetical protein
MLVTRNVTDFQRFADLRVENWSTLLDRATCARSTGEVVRLDAPYASCHGGGDPRLSAGRRTQWRGDLPPASLVLSSA